MTLNAATNGQAAGPVKDFRDLNARVHRRLIDTLDLVEARKMPADQLQRECSHRLDALLNQERCPLSAPERQQLLRDVLDEIFGLGPLEELLRDSTISDILVNGFHQVYIERNGRLEEARIAFRNNEHLLQVIQRIASQIGRRVDESSPMLDARLQDGSRVNAIIPPLALDGPALSIRRFGVTRIDAQRLVEVGALTSEMVAFLEGAVRSRTNLVISGGTGTGKTTLLNVCSCWIPDGERVITIEDAAELMLQRDHVVRLETRPANIEGKGEVNQRELVRNTLRMRPDRIIVGEVRGAEALDMLQAMNTGHEGSMTTVHANTSRDAIRRIENMVSMAGLNFPIAAIRQQMASAIDLVVHASRVTGGRRKVVSITEVTGMEGDVLCVQDIFRWRQTGVGPDGNATGVFEGCGVRPRVLDRIQAEGIELPHTLFERRVLGGDIPSQPSRR
jgi:pilus assembly protein CpaF